MVNDALAERYVDEGWWDGSTLAARVRQHALDQPEAIAVVDETTDASVSYSQLWADAQLVRDGRGRPRRARERRGAQPAAAELPRP